MELLKTVEIGPAENAKASVVWLHGLGADGHDFEPIVPYLGIPQERRVRFVFPHALRIPVTINQGMVMPAWYDIRELGSREHDLDGVRRSADQVTALLKRENERGVPTESIVLAGFSQGGVVALYLGLRYPERLAGVMALSTYTVDGDNLTDDAHDANRDVPIFYGHGTLDPMIAVAHAEESRNLLEEHGYSVEFHTYPMEHQVHPAEIEDVGNWLKGVLPA